MHLIVIIDPSTKERIDLILSSDRGYRSLDEFVERAIKNQLLLEESSSVGLSSPSLHRTQSSPSTDVVVEPSTRKELGRAEERLLRRMKARLEAVPATSRLSCPPRNVRTVRMRVIEEAEAARPLWGQVSRFAPCKLSLRILASYVAEANAEWINLDRIVGEVADSAVFAKKLLHRLESKEGVPRAIKFSTGFPDPNRNSTQRYVSQYLGYYAPQVKRAEGLLSELGFAEIEWKNKNTNIGITKEGLEFACIRSPVLDDAVIEGEVPSVLLSPDEVEYLVHHLSVHRRGELDFLRYVADSIRSGASTPTALLTPVKSYLASIKGWLKPTDAVVGTMRAGAISKLAELGVVEITRQGSKSAYSYTGSNKGLLEVSRS